MSDTIIDYIKKNKDITIEDSPFNEVDSLILAQFSYLKFDKFVPGMDEHGKYATLSDIANSPDYDSLYADERYRKNNTALFESMLQSNRFNRIKLHYFVNIIEPQYETQFAAVVIEFEEGTTYVAFRGTDENLIGWKEDLNMALSKPVPGQIRSVWYLNEVAKHIRRRFKVGGHSKGGNLAIYSAMYCKKSIKNRITEIYNHDGPGMRNEIFDEKSYLEIRNKIHMSVPHSSLVGMLLVNHDEYHVVESKDIGALQHDPYGWKVNGNSFVLADSVKSGRYTMDKSINEWVMSLNEEQINVFVDAVYDVMLATEANTLNDIIQNWTKIVPKVYEAMKGIDPETRTALGNIFATLGERAGENTKEEINIQIAEFREKIAELSLEIKEKAEEVSAEIKEKAEEVSAELKEKQKKVKKNI